MSVKFHESPAARPVAATTQLVSEDPATAVPISTVTPPTPPSVSTVPAKRAPVNVGSGASGATVKSLSASERQRTITVPLPPEWPVMESSAVLFWLLLL